VIDEFTGGNPEIKDGIGLAGSRQLERRTKKQAEPFSDPRVWEFIRKAGAARARRPNHTCRP